MTGLPEGLGTFQWILSASTRMPAATTAALATAWTGIIVALWVGALSAIGSVIVTAFGVAASGHVAGVVTFTSKSSGGIVFLSALVAAIFGFGAGFSATYASSLLGGVSVVAASLFVGIVIGLIFGLIGTAMEPTMLKWRGYRNPSRREGDTISDALQTVVDNMGLRSVPYIFVLDSPMPQAWTYSRSIVISKGLMEGLDAAELAGVMAHEMMHWRRGDGLALRMVWSFAWPVAVLYTVGMFLSGARFGVDGPSGAGAGDVHSSGKGTVKGSVTFLGFLGWIILWPSWLLTRFIIVPMTNTESRTAEYEADAGAAAAGLGGGLQRALERLSVLEIPRNAWDAAITSTHPPIELRIDALDEETYTVPADPQEASAKRVGTLVGVLAILAAMAIAPHMPYYHHQHDNWWW
jgi:Zn-dependent protease with chaperone function